MSKLNKVTVLSEFSDWLEDALNQDETDPDMVLEFRPRTSSKEVDWHPMDLDSHVVNLEKYNYRSGEPSRLWVNEGRVYTNDGSIRISDAKFIVALVRKFKKSKKIIAFDEDIDDTPAGYSGDRSFNIDSTGISVGCQDFTLEEVLEFAKKQGW